ncbi:MAG: hypothetical protein SVW51_10780 [Pseudomonadota bacterium]|nr:hypothetical protein [Pseudomonadota bacterium]
MSKAEAGCSLYAAKCPPSERECFEFQWVTLVHGLCNKSRTLNTENVKPKNAIPFYQRIIALAFVLAVIVYVASLACTYLSATRYGESTIDGINGESIEKVDLGLACSFKSGSLEPDDSTCREAILIIGDVGKGMAQSFARFLNTNPERPNLVCFRTKGGELEGAEQVAHLIRINALDTCVADYVDGKHWDLIDVSPGFCNSICPFVLLSGKNRLAIGNQFKIEVHHPGFVWNWCFCKTKHNVPWFMFDVEANEMTKLIALSPEADKAALTQLYIRAINHPFYEDKLDNVPTSEYENYALFTQYL